MKISQIFLLPFAALYSIVISGWRYYHTRVVKRVRYSIPIISVGNLQVGGTGKTPMVEYLAEKLQTQYELLILSRGYKRKLRGRRIVNIENTSEEVGDEPLMLKRKFPKVVVVVAENRIEAIPWLIQEHEGVNCVLLDDGFQQIGLNINCQILLTPYHQPFTKDKILPLGRLRESIDQSKRADVIVVTKCPDEVFDDKASVFRSIGIDLLPHQKGFLSKIQYGEPYNLFQPEEVKSLGDDEVVLLVTGIADPQPLYNYIKGKVKEVKHLSYPDHYAFKERDLMEIEQAYRSLKSSVNLRVIISEKDSTRLLQFHSFFSKMNINFFVVPITICIDDERGFDNLILSKISTL